MILNRHSSLVGLVCATLLALSSGSHAATVVTAPLIGTVICNDASDPLAGGRMAWTSGIQAGVAIHYLASTGATTASQPLPCAEGQLAGAVERKRGKGQPEYLIVTMKEVLITSVGFDTGGDGPLDSRIRTVMGERIDDVQYFDHHIDAVIRYVTLDEAGAVNGRFAQHLGMTYTSALAFDDLLSLRLDLRGGTLDLTASLTDAPGGIALRTTPVPLPEPASAGLALLALGGVVLGRRRGARPFIPLAPATPRTAARCRAAEGRWPVRSRCRRAST